MTRVVLLAGGRGERMRGLGDTPKPLVRIGARSLIEHVMASFAAMKSGTI